MYTFDSRIRYSEIDKDGNLKLESLIDYFQDCSIFQTENGPADIAYMKERSIGWILISWQIEIFRYPKLCEEVTIGTMPYELKVYFGNRNFFMDSKDGERLAVANSVWTLFDFERNFPARITQEMLDTYPLDERLDMNYADRKIVIPDGAKANTGSEIVIRKSHLDTNNHVNNGQYVRMAIEACEDKDRPIKSLRAEYKKQSVLGDVLYPEVYSIGADKADITRIIDLKDADGKSACTIELTF